LALSDTVAPQLIGHDHPRFILQTLQQPFEEAICRLSIAPGLNTDVEHNSMLIASIGGGNFAAAPTAAASASPAFRAISIGELAAVTMPESAGNVIHQL
jgi:hypothetical protein